ncbi:uncharacterized protein LOC129987656 [Argiope bruennichi]|uniref:uncharacterized protein LOC129987656 n=1 Tax=Argiope bruennichi TaxID=94029 RepID=UPI0024957E62|nr:uncharacterized protein LOC129987656 [Argiope bruennichi]
MAQMNSEELETGALQENKFPSAEEEIDKKFVSQAVAFVIGHTRNGFVALCASVATLLKEQAKLKSENESLKQQINQLQHKLESERFDLQKKYILSDHNECKLPSFNEQFPFDLSKMKRKGVQGRGYKALSGCICNSCANILENTDILIAPLKKGERVIISGEISGTVCYVGHVESLSFPEIFIGLYLDEAVGDTNGCVGKKRYFSVPYGYGMFAPLWNVCCIIE